MEGVRTHLLASDVKVGDLAEFLEKSLEGLLIDALVDVFDVCTVLGPALVDSCALGAGLLTFVIAYTRPLI